MDNRYLHKSLLHLQHVKTLPSFVLAKLLRNVIMKCSGSISRLLACETWKEEYPGQFKQTDVPKGGQATITCTNGCIDVKRVKIDNQTGSIYWNTV